MHWLLSHKHTTPGITHNEPSCLSLMRVVAIISHSTPYGHCDATVQRYTSVHAHSSPQPHNKALQMPCALPVL